LKYSSKWYGFNFSLLWFCLEVAAPESIIPSTLLFWSLTTWGLVLSLSWRKVLIDLTEIKNMWCFLETFFIT
jgi:hypothetical protein